MRSPDRNIEATVEEIGWPLIRIRTFDKRPLYVPDATFAGIAVDNPSGVSHRRVHEIVGAHCDNGVKLRANLVDVNQRLLGHPEIHQSQTTIINFEQ